MDRLSTAKRSWNMSRIRGHDTAPERSVRSMLHRMGYRFRLQSRKLPGRPDIVLSAHHAVVFVHGCFWHRHRGCKLAYTPKSRIEFWQQKFADNTRRDRTARRELARLGWKVVTIWECELKDGPALQRRLQAALTAPAKAARSARQGVT